MRKLVLGLLLLLASAVNALPIGSYYNSCRKCIVSHHHRLLRCQCINELNNWQKTQLRLTRDCDFIENVSGHLRCAMRNNPALPKGNYQLTCRFCEFNGRALTCMCPDQNKFFHRTFLKWAYLCDHIRNLNGNLVCTRRRLVLLPEGTYRSSCYHCRYDGYELTCQCLDYNNSINLTRLTAANTCRWIRNYNGQLSCR